MCVCVRAQGVSVSVCASQLCVCLHVRLLVFLTHEDLSLYLMLVSGGNQLKGYRVREVSRHRWLRGVKRVRAKRGQRGQRGQGSVGSEGS